MTSEQTPDARIEAAAEILWDEAMQGLEPWQTVEESERATCREIAAKALAAADRAAPPATDDDELDAFVPLPPNKRIKGVWMAQDRYDALVARAAETESGTAGTAPPAPPDALAALRAVREQIAETAMFPHTAHKLSGTLAIIDATLADAEMETP